MSTNAVQNCRWCGGMHPELRCPKVRALEFHPDGTVRRVEFLTPRDAANQSGVPPESNAPRAGRPGPFDLIGPLEPVASSMGART